MAMNTMLQAFARRYLKENLAQCSSAQVMIFKHMYSHNALGRDINEVVDAMPSDQLDWAMRQVETTVKKNVESLQHKETGE